MGKNSTEFHNRARPPAYFLHNNTMHTKILPYAPLTSALLVTFTFAVYFRIAGLIFSVGYLALVIVGGKKFHR